MKCKSYEKSDQGILIHGEKGEQLELKMIREDIVEVRFNLADIKEEKSMIIEERELQKVGLSFSESNEKIALSSIMIDTTVDLETGCITYFDKKNNKVWLAEGNRTLSVIDVMKYTTGDEKPVIDRVRTVDGERNFIKNLREVKDHQAYRGKLCFQWKENEGIYGLGQGEDGIYNYRHQNQYLYQHNMRIPMPMFYSDEGYGMLFDCCSLMTWQDDQLGSYLYFDAIPEMHYYFVAGGTPDSVIDGFRYLTGKASMLPKWAFGYVQSKEQYYSAKELADIVRKYRELEVPIDCVVQDWNSWESGNWGEKILDQKRYGDMKEQAEEIKKMHAHTMVSVWPNMNTGGKNHTELFQAGYLLNDYSTYDAFDENARAMYFKQANEGLLSQGFESWWCDSTEPFSGPDWSGEVKREPWERYMMVGGEHKKYLPQEKTNVYALAHAKGIYENQRKETEEIRVLNLTRSGYASGQKYAAMLWSGDTCASYDTLKKQIVEGLNMGLSGYPYWTLDIGGFFTVGSKWQNRGCGCNQDPSPKWFWQGEYNEGIQDDAYKELYVRWLQMGTFLPMFRSHGTDTPREIWNFGTKGEMFYDAIEKFIKLRYQIMPYIYSIAGAVRLENATMMRSLLFDYQDDPVVKTILDEFLFGRNILVCPVTEAMYFEPGNTPILRKKTRNCYLPKGVDWFDYWTGTKYQGGQYVEAEASIDKIPLFVKAGAVIPMKQGMQYADDQKEAPLEIHIYPDGESDFLYYEDNGNDFGYENGEYVLISIGYREKEGKKKLTISKRNGKYIDMKDTMVLHVYLKEQLVDQVLYEGDEIIVYLPDIQ